MPTHEVQNEFVHLHVHTEYSLLDGINKVTRLPEQIKAMNQPAVAMTDHGNISGSYRFYKECKNVFLGGGVITPSRLITSPNFSSQP